MTDGRIQTTIAGMSHPLILGLFTDPNAAAGAARALRALGLSPQQVSIVARSHDAEGELAQAPRVHQGRRRSLLGARLPEALARLLSPLL